MHFDRSLPVRHVLHAERLSVPAGAVALSLAVAAVAVALDSDGKALWLLVAAPWLEEVVCRWGVQDGAERIGLDPASAAAASALVFAVLHGLSRSWWLAGAVLLPALWLAFLYRHRRRLLPCVAWHAGFNAIWLVIA
jgi:membrane protease YdiL (CAAX protease family)